MINARWFESRNFGDAINPTLIKFLSGEDAVNNHAAIPHYIVAGSILAYADRNSTIWGAGFMSKDDKMIEEPKKICAVRGPMTRDQIIRHGYSCPEVYGDPVLLLPMFYNPQHFTKKNKLGVISHYVETDLPQWKKYIDKDTIYIDITANWKYVVDSILSCERIISSALHGLILAEAYKIPYTWIKPSYKIEGGEFKFIDFFSSLPYLNLTSLLNACPFRKV